MKYYLKLDCQAKYTKVSKKEYIRAEGEAGFYSKFGGNHIATAGFSGRGINGKVEYEKKDFDKYRGKE